MSPFSLQFSKGCSWHQNEMQTSGVSPRCSISTRGTVYLSCFFCMTVRFLGTQKIFFWHESKMNLLVGQFHQEDKGTQSLSRFNSPGRAITMRTLSPGTSYESEIVFLGPLPQISETSITHHPTTVCALSGHRMYQFRPIHTHIHTYTLT